MLKRANKGSFFIGENKMNIQEIEESKINPATYKPRIDLQLNNLKYQK